MNMLRLNPAILVLSMLAAPMQQALAKGPGPQAGIQPPRISINLRANLHHELQATLSQLTLTQQERFSRDLANQGFYSDTIGRALDRQFDSYVISAIQRGSDRLGENVRHILGHRPLVAENGSNPVPIPNESVIVMHNSIKKTKTTDPNSH